MIPFNLGNSLKILVFLRPPTKSVSLSQKGRREGERGGESETERQIKAPTSAHLCSALLAATSRQLSIFVSNYIAEGRSLILSSYVIAFKMDSIFCEIFEKE